MCMGIRQQRWMQVAARRKSMAIFRPEEKGGRVEVAPVDFN